MATDLGKVGIVLKGDYNSASAYEVLDAVTYNGGTYIAKQAVPANTPPTNTTYWQVGLNQRGQILSQAVGSTAWVVPLVSGMVVCYGRQASNKQGMALIDYQGNVVPLVPLNGIAISVADNQVSITCSTAGSVTLIIPA